MENGFIARAAKGAAGGVPATLVLSALRGSLSSMGIVHKTAPMQVVESFTESGFASEWPPTAKRLLTLGAHFGYGAGAGTAFGALRSEKEDYATEAAVGASLGVLIWGLGWAGWLPLLGVHQAPWSQNTSKVLLPILDHAVFGAVWGVSNKAFSRRKD
ncbi:MAG: hypothetical protein H0U65_13725 [Rubrobacter sp.]|nr:hypothetical protein [Rubrobacter sp.]